MLFTVNETAYILGVKRAYVYHKFLMSQVDGAIKILRCWRVDEASIKEMYDRILDERAGLFANDFEYAGFEERLAYVREEYLSYCQRPGRSRVQRWHRMEHSKVGSDSVAGQERMIQPELWTDGNFW